MVLGAALLVDLAEHVRLSLLDRTPQRPCLYVVRNAEWPRRCEFSHSTRQ
jgi:hypothetical protein